MERRIIFKVRNGSYLYGLQRPESDEDFMGVFMPTAHDMLGLHPVYEVDNSTKSSSSKERNTKDDVDDKTYNLHKFMHLVLQNNPNIVEVMFATDKNILILEPEFKELMDNVDKLISQKVFHTFTGYAYSQRKKLAVKSSRYGSLVEVVDFLEKSVDVKDTKSKLDTDVSKKLNRMLDHYKGKSGNPEHFHVGMSIKTVYDKLKEERDTYGWRVKTDTFDRLGYDIKFGYHLIRILAEGEELLRTSRLSYPIDGEAREDILRVRRGEVELVELLELYDKYKEKCDLANEQTVLPKKPDVNWADDWLVNTVLTSFKGAIA